MDAQCHLTISVPTENEGRVEMLAQSERMMSVSTLETVLAKRFGGGMMHYDDLMVAIADVPAVEAVVPVRCEKCLHWVEDDNERRQVGVCYCHGRKHGVRKRAAGYCDRGVRRE